MNNITTLILAGGRGERIKKLFPNTPKPLIKFENKPFLELLIIYLKSFKINNILISINELDLEKFQFFKEIGITNLITEKERLGTGGAVLNAFKVLNADSLLVINGDTLCPLNLENLINSHLNMQSDITIGVTNNSEKREDGGNILIDKNNKVIEFSEKKRFNNESYINTGIYMINKKFLQTSQSVFSLEKFIEQNINKKVFAYIANKPIYDYGTPERYNLYKSIIGEYSKSF